jgi:hypothetical protein
MPGACRNTPAIDRSSVVLPAPFAPMIATASPFVQRQVDPEQRLKIPVPRRQARCLQQCHQTSIPR